MPRILAVALYALVFASCGSPTGPDAFVGNYDLEAVDGEPLPVRYFLEEHISGTLILRENRTLRMTNTSRTLPLFNQEPEISTWSTEGKWTRSGNVVSLTGHEGGDLGTATIDGDQLIVDIYIVTNTYRRATTGT